MPRQNWEDGSEIVKQDLNNSPIGLQREFYDRVVYELIQRAEDSFFGDSFLCQFSAANAIIINKGVGFQTDLTQVNPEPTKRLLYLDADFTQNLDAPDSVNDRIDIVCVKATVVDSLTASRKYKDATPAGTVTTQTLVVQKDWEPEILLVQGVAAISPSVPATPSGYIKIAELYQNAAVGLSGAGDVDDKRSLMPLGSSTTLNTLGFSRLPAGAGKTLIELFTSTDGFLKNGYFEYFDIDDLGSDPAAPASGKVRIYSKNDVTYKRAFGGAITPLGSGGGGGGSLKWFSPSGEGPVEEEEYGESVFMFEQGLTQKVVAFIKVPDSYLTGRKISMIFGAYSPSASNQFKLQAKAYLIRKNNDAIDSVANLNTADSGDLTNTVAKRYRQISIDLSSSLGAINSLSVQPNDIIKVELSRIVPSGTEDTDTIRFISSSTEVKFG